MFDSGVQAAAAIRARFRAEASSWLNFARRRPSRRECTHSPSSPDRCRAGSILAGSGIGNPFAHCANAIRCCFCVFSPQPENYFRHYQPLFLCAVRTGLRLGELIALEWRDVDVEKRSIRVRRNRTRGEVSSPKSRQARSVDLSAEATESIRGLLFPHGSRRTKRLSRSHRREDRMNASSRGSRLRCQ